MTPDNFLTFADTVAKSNAFGPAGYRSAISRAYYSVFHAARDIIEKDLKVRITSGQGRENTHKLIQEYLENCHVAEAATVGRLIGNLHSSRKDADYELLTLEIETQQNAVTCIARANSILAKLQAVLSGPDRKKVIAGMVQYRKLRQGA